ncbi:MAG: metalloregulator ArsR/SmtB family transcription factor [Proteiniphilum sp.]|nr:metalloregulator ArsR/SmtB family transcription factor [Proteiniphilum sp.]
MKKENQKLESADLKVDRSFFEEAAYMLKAVANEIRLCVVMQLACTAEKTVSELKEGMDCEQSLLSHHLTDMRAKGILQCRKSGKHSYYSLKDKRFANVLRCLVNCGNHRAEKESKD